MAFFEILFQGDLDKSTLAAKISLKIPISVGAQKGGWPHNRMYMITPMDHTSCVVIHNGSVRLSCCHQRENTLE